MSEEELNDECQVNMCSRVIHDGEIRAMWSWLSRALPASVAAGNGLSPW
jgi:hypothetical protein